PGWDRACVRRRRRRAVRGAGDRHPSARRRGLPGVRRRPAAQCRRGGPDAGSRRCLRRSARRHGEHVSTRLATGAMMSAPPDQDGRTFIVTGATGGIGMVTARELAARGATVVITSRSPAKGRAALDELRTTTNSDRVQLLSLELGDLGSVRGCAQPFLQSGEPLHGLINNAGLAGQRGLTASGFELAFGSNPVGTFLLTELLTPR